MPTKQTARNASTSSRNRVQVSQQPEALEEPTAIADSSSSSASALVQNPARETNLSIESIASSINKFGSLLLQKLHKLHRNELPSIALSPASLVIAISMITAGAQGNTEQQLMQTLQLAHCQQLHDSMSSLMKQLAINNANMKLKIANKLFIDNNYKVNPMFTSQLQQYYESELTQLSLHDRNEAAKIINSWVAQQTENKVTTIVAPNALVEVRLFLVNVIHFKASWLFRFEKSWTKQEKFELDSKGRTVKCDMMEQREHLKHVQNEFVTIVKLPFTNRRFSALVVMPTKRHGLQELIESRPDILNDVIEWIKHPKDCELFFHLPKFALNFKESMRRNELLPAMGMTDVFKSGVANLKGINEHLDLYIAELMHQVVLEVDEDGAEMVAVTSMCVTDGVSRNKPPTIKVDQPFLFLITDNITNCVLCTAAVMNPKYGH